MSSRRVLVATHFCSQLRGRALATLAMFGIMLLTYGAEPGVASWVESACVLGRQRR